MQKKRIFALILIGFALFTLLGGFLISTHRPQEVAHHMAPNDYNIERGNLNEAMVHHGFDLGVMPVAPDVGSGKLNRAEDPWTPMP